MVLSLFPNSQNIMSSPAFLFFVVIVIVTTLFATMSNKSNTETKTNIPKNPMLPDNGDKDDKAMDNGEKASQEETVSVMPNKKNKVGWGPSKVMQGLLCNFIKVANQDKYN